MIRIFLEKLDIIPIPLKGSAPIELLESANSDIFQFNTPLEYDLQVSIVNGGVLVKGSISTQVHAVCGRCLSEDEIIFENLEVCHYYETLKGSTLDIDDEIREDLLIKMPLNYICDENCKGLCPQCGQNLNKKKCKCKETKPKNDIWKDLDKLDIER